MMKGIRCHLAYKSNCFVDTQLQKMQFLYMAIYTTLCHPNHLPSSNCLVDRRYLQVMTIIPQHQENDSLRQTKESLGSLSLGSNEIFDNI